MNPFPAELAQRRLAREPIIRVWDIGVRTGHWLMALCFTIMYLDHRRFPIHSYAGYLMFILVVFRIAWGFFGSRAAQFRAFLFSPKEVLEYSRSALSGHAAYYVSHNPMGAWMVYALLAIMLLNCSLGLMLYSAGQQLGPLGNSVPSAWEDGLLWCHRMLGHSMALLVGMHMFGVIWAARQHRENYVAAMFTGCKRVPRNVQQERYGAYAGVPEEGIPPPLRPLERWMNHAHPMLGSLIVVVLAVLGSVWITFSLYRINKYLLAY